MCKRFKMSENLQIVVPENFNEALKLKQQGVIPIAGGTDILAQMAAGVVPRNKLMSISNLQEMKQIEEVSDTIRIGSLVTHSEIVNSDLINKYLPALVAAASSIGAKQIQNSGTIGGNIANASPAADLPPVLLAADTSIELASLNCHRFIDYSTFHTGYRKMEMVSDELIVAVQIKKLSKGEKEKFVKIGTRKAQAISKVSGAFRVKVVNNLIEDIKIAYGSMAATPLRLYKVEDLLKNKELNKENIQHAIDLVKKSMIPIDDVRSTAQYRSHVSSEMLRQFLLEL